MSQFRKIKKVSYSQEPSLSVSFYCYYHGDVPGLDYLDVPHQILPGQQALHVHKHALPHRLQLLQVSIQSEDQKVLMSSCEFAVIDAASGASHPATLLIASLLVGETRKQIDGTLASLPLSFSTLHLKGCELLSRAHSSPRCTVIWRQTRCFLNCQVVTSQVGRTSLAYLHLLKVTHSLDGQLALNCCGRVPWFQLDDGLGPLVQAFQVSSELLQLLFLILHNRRNHQTIRLNTFSSRQKIS